MSDMIKDTFDESNKLLFLAWEWTKILQTGVALKTSEELIKMAARWIFGCQYSSVV